MKSLSLLLIGILGLLQSCNRQESIRQTLCIQEDEQEIVRLNNGLMINYDNEMAEIPPCSANLEITAALIQYIKEIKPKVGKTQRALLEEVESGIACNFFDLFTEEDLRPLTGRDSSYSVLFTGYYTPKFEASCYQDSIYSVPIWSSERILSFDTIQLSNDSILVDTLEEYETLLYLKTYFDRYQLYLQGSALVKLESKEEKYLVFEKSNRRRFKNLNTIIHLNDSLPSVRNYGFNSLKKYYYQHQDILDSIFASDEYRNFYKIYNSPINSALGIQLKENLSVAVDPSHHVLGSIFIAEFPVANSGGKIESYEYRFLIASDVGSYIDRDYKFDIYCGEGSEKAQKAQVIKHYGRMWKIEPKKQDN